jgi:hypothetical protein
MHVYEKVYIWGCSVLSVVSDIPCVPSREWATVLLFNIFEIIRRKYQVIMEKHLTKFNA